MDKKPYLITTAIAYASKKPHVGNTYDVVCADAIARFRRMQGYDVFFLTGTDEHGQKIEELAAASRGGAAGDALLFDDDDVRASQLCLDGCCQTARARAEQTGRPDDITAAVLRLESCGH